MKAILPLAILLFSSAVAALNIKAVRIFITSDREPEKRYITYEYRSEPKLIELQSDETLGLAFSTFDHFVGYDVKPHQAFLRFYDEQSGEEGIHPIKISASNKGRFQLNMKKPPPSLPPTTSHPLNVSIILGSFEFEPQTVSLFSLALPPSGTVPPHPEEVQYHPQPEIVHTFRPEQTQPPVVLPLIFAGLALAPWALLGGLLSRLPISVQANLSTAPFLGLLAALEALLCWYWVDLKLGQVLAYGAVLGLLTAAAGKRALSSL